MEVEQIMYLVLEVAEEEVARVREGHGAYVAGLIGAEHRFLPFQDTFLTGGREEALALAQRWGASLENMEGAAFARACLALGVRGAELRAISNPAGVREKAHWRTKEALSALARAVRRLLAEEGGARRPPG